MANTGNNSSWGNLTNSTSYDTLESVFDLSRKLSIVFGVLQIVLGFVFNLLLLVVVLGKKELRRDVRNMLIANLAVADLFAMGLLLPIDIALETQRGWTLGCYPHIIVQFLYLFVFSFVSVWGLVCLDSLLLARVCRMNMPLTSFLTSAVTTFISVWKRRMDRAVVVLVVALPWVLSVTVITPIVLTGLHEFHKTVWTSQSCYFMLVRWALLALNILFFFLPCLLVLLLLSTATCVLCCQRRRRGAGTITPANVSSLGEVSSAILGDRPGGYLAASLLTFLMMGPSHILSMVNLYQGLPVLADIPSWVLATHSLKWVSDSKSVCLPVVWLLLLPDLRARAGHLLTSGKRAILKVKDEPRFDPSVSYKNLDH
ncbi:hypothetical protein ACOMHN_018617 [Nucella lapillus]